MLPVSHAYDGVAFRSKDFCQIPCEIRYSSQCTNNNYAAAPHNHGRPSSVDFPGIILLNKSGRQDASWAITRLITKVKQAIVFITCKHTNM